MDMESSKTHIPDVGDDNGDTSSVPKAFTVKCKKCKKAYKSNSILKHLKQNQKQNCLSKYTEEELDKMKQNSKKLSKHKETLWKEKNYSKVLDQNKRYNRQKLMRQKREEIKQKYADNIEDYKISLVAEARNLNAEMRDFCTKVLEEKSKKGSSYCFGGFGEVVKRDMNSLKDEINTQFMKIERKIEKVVKKTQNENDWDSLAISFSKLIQTFTPTGKLLIKEKWNTTKFSIEMNFKYMWKYGINGEKVCKGCELEYETNTILTHLGKNRKCYNHYTKEELEQLKKDSKDLTKYKSKVREDNTKAISKKKKKAYKKLKANPEKYAALVEKRKRVYKESIPKRIEKLKRQKLAKFEFEKKNLEKQARRKIANEKAFIELILMKEIERLKSLKMKEELNQKLTNIENQYHDLVDEFEKIMCEKAEKASKIICCHSDTVPTDSIVYPWMLRCSECYFKLSELYEPYPEFPTRDRLPRFESFYNETFEIIMSIAEEVGEKLESPNWIWLDHVQGTVFRYKTHVSFNCFTSVLKEAGLFDCTICCSIDPRDVCKNCKEWSWSDTE